MSSKWLFTMTVLIGVSLSTAACAQCPEDTVDRGECDTLTVTWWETKIDTNTPPPYLIHVSFLVTHDQLDPIDSICAFEIPLTWSHTNPAACCSVPVWESESWNNPYAWWWLPPFHKSIFRHLWDANGDTVHNRMADLAADFSMRDWDNIFILPKEDTVLMAFIIADHHEDMRWWEGHRTLLATLTFMVSDTMHICIDSIFWHPASRLSYGRADGARYIPRHNMPLCIQVRPGEPHIVVKPNGGEYWEVGTVQQICWAYPAFGDSVDLEYSTDGGTSWIQIATNVKDAGWYSWLVPDVFSNSCLVRISDPANPNRYDVSDGHFLILGHDVGVTQILAPTGVVPLNVPLEPQVILFNNTGNPDTGMAFFEIGHVYADSVSFSLMPGEEDTISFSTWTPSEAAAYITTGSIQLVGEKGAADDVLHGVVSVSAGYGPEIHQVIPDFGVSGYVVTVTLIGERFDHGMTARLTLTGEPDIVADTSAVNFVSDTTIEVTFDLADAVIDRWDLEISNQVNESYRFYRGFEVIPFEGQFLPFCSWEEFIVHDGSSIEIGVNVPEVDDLFILLKKSNRIGYCGTWWGSMQLMGMGQEIASESGNDDFAIHLTEPEPGWYTLEISSDDPGEGLIKVCSALDTLTLGEWYIGEILRPYGFDWVQFDLSPGQSILYFQTEGFGLWSTLDVYYEHLTDPTQHWQFSNMGAGYHIEGEIPNPPAGRYYVRYMDSAVLYGGDDQVRQYLLFVDTETIVDPPPLSPTITGLSAYTGGTEGPVTVIITGTGLDSAATVSLIRDSFDDIFANSVLGDSTGLELSATFDLSQAEPGEWQLVVTNPGGQSDTAASPFVVESGGEPDLWIELVGRSQIRVGRFSSYIARFGNSGNVDSPPISIFLLMPGHVEFETELASGLEEGDTTLEYGDEVRILVVKLAGLTAGTTDQFLFSIRTQSLEGMEISAYLIDENILPAPPDTARGVETNRLRSLLSLIDEPYIKKIQIWPPMLKPDGTVIRGHPAYVTSDGWVIHFTSSSGVTKWLYNPDDPNLFAVRDIPNIPDAQAEALYDWAQGEFERQQTFPNQQIPYDPTNYKQKGPDYYQCDGFIEKGLEVVGYNSGKGLVDSDCEKWLGIFRDLAPWDIYNGLTKDDPSAPKYPIFKYLYLKMVAGYAGFVSDLINYLKSRATDDITLLVDVVSSSTPEDKCGPSGFDTLYAPSDSLARFIRGDRELNYRIDFWNKEDATAPAQIVFVEDTLETDFDVTTFGFSNVGFLRWNVPLQGGQYFNVNVDMRPDDSLIVNIEGTFDPDHRAISWVFRSLDPITGEPPEDPMAGFLPPIDSTGYQIGWVDFKVEPLPDLPTGTQITNQAFVNFDSVGSYNPAPKEGPYLNTIDAGAPSSDVHPLSDTIFTPYFTVSWSGADDDSGSGIAFFSIYCSKDLEPYSLWIANTLDTSATFTGESGHAYYFYSIASDNVGHFETEPDSFDARTTVYFEYTCGDATGNGVVDLGDVLHLISYLYKGGPSPEHFEAGDVNCDGGVDLGDILYLINYLYKNGPAPCQPDLKLMAKTHPASAELTVYAFGQDQAGLALFIDGEFDVNVFGVQLELQWDKENLELSSISQTIRTEKLGLYHNNGKEGELKVGMVDISGKEYISAGKGALLKLNMKSKADSLDLSSLEIKEAILVDENGRKLAVKIVNKVSNSNLPKEFSLSQNYPNPFNPQTVIRYALPRNCEVKITIYNILGQKVRTLVDEHQNAGYKRVEWDSKNDGGEEVSSGVYFYRIKAGEFTESKKMVILK